MEEIELELANLDFAQQNGEAFNLMLKQKNGNRFLPVVIGVYEAKTIILQVNKIKVKRPLVHDIFLQLCDHLHAKVQKVLIKGYKNGIYYVQIQLLHQGEMICLDSRLSDAVVIALKNDIPIFVTAEVFFHASYELSENEGDNDDFYEYEEEEEELRFPIDPAYLFDSKDKSQIIKILSQFSEKQLKELLQLALDKEAYEAAAQIDEELTRRSAYGK